ncbi:MAG: GDSL-type esterase/lipase family protein [Patescibacteria group bacterium]|nr:GDSL-type esterase/lipase family protein [Patescibacteria group bacterium]
MSTICIFGDSTAWGAWDKEKGGWVNRLWLFLADKDYYTELYNLSISGGTTETIMNRFEAEAKAREAEVLIFQTGGNDASYEHTPDNYLVPPEKFQANLEEIIRRAQKISRQVLFIGFKNVDESRTKPVSWQDVYYTNQNISRYNEIMKTVCAESGIPFLEVFGALTNEDLEDGVHPNARGHEKIFERVKTFLNENGVTKTR